MTWVFWEPAQMGEDTVRKSALGTHMTKGGPEAGATKNSPFSMILHFLQFPEWLFRQVWRMPIIPVYSGG